MDMDIILKHLGKIEEALNCNVCHKICINPVRVKVCGHYFCLKCFQMNNEPHLCLKCKLYYEEGEIDYNNIAKESESALIDLKEFLLKSENKPSVDCISEAEDDGVEKFTDQRLNHCFRYNNKKYHMNYIDEYSTKVNAKGETFLHIACKKNKIEEVRQLIKKGVDLNAKDYAGWVPLHEAIVSGNVEITEILLKNGALINVPGEEYVTPLHRAVMSENEYLIRLLLKNGADIDQLDYFGKKPVEYTQNNDIKNIFSNNIYTERVQELFCPKNITAYLYYVEEDYKQKIIKTKFAKILKEYDGKKVTHFFIRRSHKLSIKMLVAMLDACFLVPQEWIDNFLNNDYFIDIPNFNFISNELLNSGIKKAAMNSLLRLPKLFDGLYFFIHGHSHPVVIHNVKFTKESIGSLIVAGGGKILHRPPTPATCERTMNFPYHSNREVKKCRCCHYIIFDDEDPPTLQYQMSEIKHKSSKWLIECVINYTIYD